MAPPKVILQLYPMIPAADEEDRKRRRPMGRNRDLYNKAIHDWLDIIRAAEELGVWGASTIEHHLHSEGYEVGPNPGILNAWWASQFKKIHVGALGYVMATQDPIRVAEQAATLDLLSAGRLDFGIGKGYRYNEFAGFCVPMAEADHAPVMPSVSRGAASENWPSAIRMPPMILKGLPVRSAPARSP